MDISGHDLAPTAPEIPKTGRRAITANDLIILLICFSQLAMGVSQYVEPLRYIQYAVGPAVFAVWLTFGSRRWYRHSSRYLIAEIIITASIVLSAATTGEKDYRIVTFLLLPLLTGAFLGNVSYKNMTWIWVCFVISALIYNSPKPRSGEYSINLIYSGSIAESQLTFTLAILFITMISMKEWRRVFFGFLLLIIMVKRIAIGGLLLSYAVWLISRSKRISTAMRNGRQLTSTSAAFLFLTFGTIAFHLNAIALVIFLNFQQFFDTVERITLGRYKLAETMQAYMENAGTAVTNVLGFGPGSSRSIIGDAYFHATDFNVLNDYLLVRFEYGWLGLVAFFAAYALAISQSRWGLILCAFQAIVFMTDNTLIYAFHTQIVVVCSIFLMSRERQGLA
jgi:hypothetical protein